MTQNLTLGLLEPLIWPLVTMRARAQIALLWQINDRLSALSFAGREPALRQIRLAWWRDALTALAQPDAKAPAEPLLVEIAQSSLVPAQLAALADARLIALSSDWADADVGNYGDLLFAATGGVLMQAGGGGAAWALVDVAQQIDDPERRAEIFCAATNIPAVPMKVRCLVVLDRLARSIARNGGARNRAREQAIILRVGLFGR